MSSSEHNENDAATSRPARWVPSWIIVLTLLLAYLGVIYVDDHGAAFSKTVYGPWKSDGDFAKLLPAKDPVMDLGRERFNFVCAGCHLASGLGIAGLNPPLVGSEWVLDEGPNRIIRIVLNGLSGPIKVKGTDYSAGVMIAFRDQLDDKTIAAIVTYIRGNPDWDHKMSPVKPEEVAKIRKETADRASNWTAQELLAVPVKD